MQYISERASFSIKSNDIAIQDTPGIFPITNLAGTINVNRTIHTWFSINLEDILGDLYNKHDVFNLRLKSLTNSSLNPYGVTPNDRGITFIMSGLNWVGSNYDVIRGCNTNGASIGCITLTQGIAANTLFEESFITTFYKQKTADLTISMLNANFLPPDMAAGTLMPRFAFYFDVFPVVISPPPCISLGSSKCSTINAYYLAVTTETNNLDMYAILGRENFELGAKYNLVFKFAQMATSLAGTGGLLRGSIYNIYSSGMRFQNYETAINKGGGTKMQLIPYASFNGPFPSSAVPVIIRSNTSNIMTFTLEAQICNMTIRIQSLLTNQEFTTPTSNIFLSFDVWKCAY
jgi:hypothetical protein